MYRTYRIIGREVFAVVNKQLAVVKMPRWSSMTQGSAGRPIVAKADAVCAVSGRSRDVA